MRKVPRRSVGYESGVLTVLGGNEDVVIGLEPMQRRGGGVCAADDRQNSVLSCAHVEACEIEVVPDLGTERDADPSLECGIRGRLRAAPTDELTRKRGLARGGASFDACGVRNS